MVYILRPGQPTFPNDLQPDEHGLVAIGGELSVGVLVEAYTKGIFPWTGAPPIPWFSPDPRMILEPGNFHVSRSLRKVLRRGDFECRFDHDFPTTIRACASIPRIPQDSTWITANMIAAYSELHAMGIAHSVEAYRGGELCGGLYGLALGRAFFGESMFARVPNASKVALHALCTRLHALDFYFVDCQQVTGHLASLGAVAVARQDYLTALRGALGPESVNGPW